MKMHVIENVLEDVRTTSAQVATSNVLEVRTSEHVTTIGVDVLGGVGVARNGTVEGVTASVTEEVTRGVVKEAIKYAYEDVVGYALAFSCFIW